MAKKTAKPSQQKTKEEQWRRRMAAQGQMGAVSAVAEPGTPDTDGVDTDATYTTSSATVTRVRPASTATVAKTSAARGTGTATTMQRNAARAARAKLATSAMSLEDEMHYIKADIRKLVILTVSCLLVIIALAFVIPSIIK